MRRIPKLFILLLLTAVVPVRTACPASMSATEREKREEIRESLRKMPAESEAYKHYLEGGTFLMRHDLDKAIEAYQAALEYQPDNPDIRFSLANALYENGSKQEAMSEWGRCLKLDPEFAEVYLKLGDAHKEAGEPDRAVEYYKKGLELRPDDQEFLSALAALYEAEGKSDESLSVWRDIDKLDPSSAEAHYRFGVEHSKKSETDAAIAEFDKAISLKPDEEKFFFEQGRVFAVKARIFKENAAHLAGEVKAKPEDEDLKSRYAQAQADAELFWDKAVRSWTEAVRLREDFAAARIELGGALWEQGKIKESLDQFREAVNIEPRDADARTSFANALLQSGSAIGAIDQFKEALSISPGRADAQLGLAAAYKEQGLITEAVAELEEYKAGLPAVGRKARKEQRRIDRIIKEWTPVEE